MVYQWKPKSMLSHLMEAQKVGEELERIRKRHRGKLTAKYVVAAAKNERSVLHSGFEWDDAVAAEKHRLEQARKIIQSIEVVIQPRQEDEPTVIRAFVNVTNGERHFTSIHVALSEPGFRQQLLEQAYADLEAWRKKYAELQELAHIFDVIDNSVLAGEDG